MEPRHGDKGMLWNGLYPQTVFHCMEKVFVSFTLSGRMFSLRNLKNADGM